MTNTQVTNEMNALKNVFQAGYYWTSPASSNSPNNVSTTPKNTNGYVSNNFNDFYECFGFAYYMGYLMFGTYPVGVNDTIKNLSLNGANYSGWKIYTQSYCNSVTLEPGDIIRFDSTYGYHAAIVWKVNGNSVEVAEVLGGENCLIAWGYPQYGDESITAAYIKNNAVFIAKAPKTTTGVDVRYNIKNFYYSKYLTIRDATVSNHKNVSLAERPVGIWTKWVIDESKRNNTYIRTSLSTAYGLNVYRTGSPYNCDIFSISGNETDAAVNYIYNSMTGCYMIKLSNYNLYLTAGSDGNVYWGEYSSNLNTQLWQIT